jgi:hypothetical protein
MGFVAVLGSARASIQDVQERSPRRMIEIFGGQTAVGFLGTQNKRNAYGVGYGVSMKPPRWLSAAGNELLLMGYFHTSMDLEDRKGFAKTANSIGTLAILRYPSVRTGRGNIYFDLGVGLYYANHSTLDLDSKLNSTPMIGLSFGFNRGNIEYLLGARLLHISNAGTKGKNLGSNQLLFTFGIRF